jgi:dipeptidyl aminopeptidase/acylaminoacyl peptidase
MSKRFLPVVMNAHLPQGLGHRAGGVLAALALLILIGSARADFPQRPPGRSMEGGIQWFEISLKGEGPGQTMTLWLYLPPGEHPAKSLGCVFVAPAGSNLMTGMTLSDEDRAEQLPYVNAGYAVIAYELDGKMKNRTLAAAYAAAPRFIAAHGGVDNARTAIDYALARVPEIDPRRLYTAGHSSAATVALDVAAADPRIAACCAYAPGVNLLQRWGEEAMAVFSRHVNGFRAFAAAASPSNHLDELKTKPLLLFTARDDANIPTQRVQDFAAALKRAGSKRTKLVTVAAGGHYQSMIDHGIPAGIAFLKDLDAKLKQ